MIACALTGPISGKASSSSLVAVLIFTAASANAENSSVTSNSRNLFIHSSEGKWTSGCEWRVRSLPDTYNAVARSGVDRCRANERSHAFRDALRYIAHGRHVARGAQPPEVRLRKALVLAYEPQGKSDVFDCTAAMQRVEGLRRRALRGAAGVDRFGRHRVEGRRIAGAHVENPGTLGMIQKVEIDLDNIVDAHKIPPLFASSVSI